MLTVSYDTMLKYMNVPARNPRDIRPDLSDEATRVLMKGIARLPDHRFQSMNEFLVALRGLRNEQQQ